MQKLWSKRSTSGEIASFLTILTFVMIVGGVVIGSRIASSQRLQTASQAQGIIPTVPSLPPFADPSAKPGFDFTPVSGICKAGITYRRDPIITQIEIRDKASGNVFLINESTPSLGKGDGNFKRGSQFDLGSGATVVWGPPDHKDEIYVLVDNGRQQNTKHYYARPAWLGSNDVEVVFYYDRILGPRNNPREIQKAYQIAVGKKGCFGGGEITPTTIATATPIATITPQATVTPCPNVTTMPTGTVAPTDPNKPTPPPGSTSTPVPPTGNPCPSPVPTTITPTPCPTGPGTPCPTITPKPTEPVGQCPLRIKEYVRICDDATCSTSRATNEFDNALNPSSQFEAYYGSSNDEQLNSKNKVTGQPFGNKPWPFLLWGHPYTDPFAEGSVSEPGVIWFKVPDWKPAASSYYKPGSTALVRGFFNGDKYDLHHIDCKKNGGEGKPCPGATVSTQISAGSSFIARDGRTRTVSALKDPNNPDPSAKDWLVADIPDLALDCKMDYEYGFYLVKKSDQPEACYFRPRNFVQFRLNGQDREVNAFSDIGSQPGFWATINGLRAKLGTSDAFKNFFYNASDPDKKYLRYDPCAGINGGKGCQTQTGKGDFAPGTSGYIVNKDTACVILYRDPKFKVVEKCVPDVKSLGGSLDIDKIRFDKYNCDPVTKTVNSTPDPNNLDPDHQDVICGLPVACSTEGVKYDYGWILEPEAGVTVPPTPPLSITPAPTCVEEPKGEKITLQLDLEAADLPDNHGLANPCFVVADNKTGLLNRQDEAYPNPCRVQKVTFANNILGLLAVAYHNTTNQTIKIGYQINKCNDAQVETDRATGRAICNEYWQGNYNSKVTVPSGSVYTCTYNHNDIARNPDITCEVKAARDVPAQLSRLLTTQSSTSPLGGGDDPTVTPRPTLTPKPTDYCIPSTTGQTSRGTNPLPQPNINLLQKADVIVDRSVNALDVAACIKEWAFGRASGQKCDLNLNSVVDAIDVAQVLKLIGKKY